MKVQIYTHDPMLTLVRTEEESKDLFGEDGADLTEVPDELANELIEAYNTVKRLSRELKKYER